VGIRLKVCPYLIRSCVTRSRRRDYTSNVKAALLNQLLGHPTGPAPLPVRRPLYVRRFLTINRFLLRCLFSRIDINVSDGFTAPDGSTVVYTNHPSFWDPLICALALEKTLPLHAHFAPIDETSLKKHLYFQGLGFFGLQLDSIQGLRRFLEVGKAVLTELDRGALVVTPEGRFTNPYTRPVRLKRGVTRLLLEPMEREITVLPLAIHYELGENPKPVTWLRYGKALTVKPNHSWTKETLHKELEGRLVESIDQNLRRSENLKWGRNLLERPT